MPPRSEIWELEQYGQALWGAPEWGGPKTGNREPETRKGSGGRGTFLMEAKLGALGDQGLPENSPNLSVVLSLLYGDFQIPALATFCSGAGTSKENWLVEKASATVGWHPFGVGNLTLDN